jgi:tetratricopeptide (TPR) repeat protein
MDELQNKIGLMKQEIDALQIKIMAEHTPWYKSASVLISAVALLFSFGTTAVSYYRSGQDDIRAARVELRGILQRLTALPKDNFELFKKYQGDVTGQALIGSLINQENSLLARQASDIVDRFPGYISSSEYLSVSVALMNAADVEKVPRYLERALELTSDPNTKVAILRNYGTLLLNTGQGLEGRRRYEQALSIWGLYPKVTTYFKDSTNAWTEMYWAQAEFGVNNLEAAKEHLRKASQQAAKLPPGPVTSQTQEQITSTGKFIEQSAPADQTTATRLPGG